MPKREVVISDDDKSLTYVLARQSLPAPPAQLLRPGGGNRNAGAAFWCRLTVNEATLLSGLPNRQAWARRPPGLKDFGVGAWVRADPFEEIEDEGVDSVGHDGLSHRCAASGVSCTPRYV
jgi:hypothetical protein